MRQQIKINGIWAVIPSNFSVTIKRTNPLFNSEGDFSFPFTLDVVQNRSIIQSAADPHGRFALRRLNGLPIEYWFDGQLIFRGITEVKDSIQFKDTISINFVSGVKTLTERIKDMNAQDVSVEDFQLGYACTGLRFSAEKAAEIRYTHFTSYHGIDVIGDVYYLVPVRFAFDTGYAPSPVKNALYTSSSAINVSSDCRSMPFCNTRLALDVSNANKYRVLDYNRRDAAPCMFVLYWLKRLFMDLGVKVKDEYTWNDTEYGIEDMNRLAFMSVFPKYTTKDWTTPPTGSTVVEDSYTGEKTPYLLWEQWNGKIPQYDFGAPYVMDVSLYMNTTRVCIASPDDDKVWKQYIDYNINNDDPFVPAENHYTKDIVGSYGFRPAYLSSEQYPDIDASKIVDDLHNIFGLRIIYDPVTNKARVCYVRDIIKKASVNTKMLNAMYTASPVVTRELNNGVVVTYGKEMDEKSTKAEEAAYDYDMPENVKNSDGTDSKDESGHLVTDTAKVVVQDAGDTLAMTPTSTDRKTYYDQTTGNAFRIMVDEDSEENNQGATQIEVGQYNDYRIGVTDTDNENYTTYTAGFEPVTCNDVYHSQYGVHNYTESDLCPFVKAEQTNYSTDEIFDMRSENEKNNGGDYAVNKMCETFYVNKEEAPEGWLNNKWTGMPDMLEMLNFKYYNEEQHHKFTTVLYPHKFNFVEEQPLYQQLLMIKYATNHTESCDMTSSDSPLQKWQDSNHYVLGFMRGPGNAAGREYSSTEYNEDGTRDWYDVVGTPTFTADSVDQFGHVFDYNGDAAGGVDQTGRLSLRLDARKVYGYDEDGMPKFYPIDSNYADRGVAVKMLSDYLYLESHKKTLTHKAHVSVGQLTNIDWCSHYNLQQCVGFINSVQFTLSENGVGESTIEQYVLD